MGLKDGRPQPPQLEWRPPIFWSIKYGEYLTFEEIIRRNTMPLQSEPQQSTRTATIYNALCERQESLLAILNRLANSLDRLNGPGIQADASESPGKNPGVINEIDTVL